MACGDEEQNWLDMAILDLQQSKRTEAMALDQVRTLLKEKELLEKKLKIQSDMWELDKRRLEQTLMQEKREHEKTNTTQSYQIAALNVSLGSYQQKASIFKLRQEGALDEVDILSSRLQISNVQIQEKDADYCALQKACLERERQLKQKFDTEKSYNEAQQRASTLQRISELKKKHDLEMENFKIEHAALILKKNEEVSALLREKNFVWDQFKRMEEDYTSRLETKRQELKRAEEALQKLQLRVDELQKAFDEKAVEATILRVNVQSAEAEILKVREDLLQLQPSEHGAGNSDVYGMVMQTAVPTMVLSSEEAQCLRNGQEKGGDHLQVTKLLAEKEEELKKAKRFMEDLRLENQNLQSLYADLEQQFKGKKKQGKSAHDHASGTTSRNLNADLEAVAVDDAQYDAQLSPKAFAEFKKRRLASGSYLAQHISKRLEQPQSACKDIQNMMDLSAKDPSIEMKADDANGQTLIQISQQIMESKLKGYSTSTKNRLFSSKFGVPKIIA